MNLTRGVFAPNNAWRAQVIPTRRARYDREPTEKTPAERHAAMKWAHRLKRVFNSARASGSFRLTSGVGSLVPRRHLKFAGSCQAKREPDGLGDIPRSGATTLLIRPHLACSRPCRPIGKTDGAGAGTCLVAILLALRGSLQGEILTSIEQ